MKEHSLKHYFFAIQEAVFFQTPGLSSPGIDLLAILRKSLDQATFLYIFIREVRLNGVRASIAIVHIRKIYKI